MIILLFGSAKKIAPVHHLQGQNSSSLNRSHQAAVYRGLLQQIRNWSSHKKESFLCFKDSRAFLTFLKLMQLKKKNGKYLLMISKSFILGAKSAGDESGGLGMNPSVFCCFSVVVLKFRISVSYSNLQQHNSKACAK
jgi:hypothetical protein